MYGYFSFDVRRSQPSEHVLCIFCATASPNAEAVNVVIRWYCESAVSPDRIVILGMESEQSVLEQIAQSESLLGRLPQHTRIFGTPPVSVGLIPRTGLFPDTTIAGIPWNEIQLRGMVAIFRTRHALLVAPETHHFKKPSTRHSDRFIRTANALVDGAEITFIAACCLRFISENIRHYYCDTGGISVLAFAIDSLRRRFNGASLAATVNTFESYDGLKSFEFRETEASAVLISASTSCGLEDEVCLREKRFRPSQVVTVFSIGKRDRFSNVMLDIEKDSALRLSLEPWKSFRDGECPLCAAGSIAVPMLGDQFIPIRSETRSILLLKENSPGWLPRILEMFSGHECLRAFYRSGNTFHATNDVFIDVEKLIRNPALCPEFTKRITRMIAQSVPAAARRVIHLDDPASQCFAELIATQLRAQCREDHAIAVIPAVKAADEAVIEQGACIVVAAAVASGQSLLAVSQLLRTIQRSNAVSYVIGVTRMPTAGHVDKLERDIRMGELASDYGFAICERVNLPLAGRKATCAWDDELELLQEWANSAVGNAKDLLEERIQLLRSAQSDANRGLAEGLFWTSTNGQPLKLRHGYVFLPRGVDASNMSQGDVYFSISAVLHNLRNFGANPPLRQSEYERRVLSPLCFDRFNDGVIQASLVRAAIPPEMNYSDTPEASRQMGAILREMFASFDSGKGEASRELLLALCLGRLVLTKEDLNKLHQEFQSCSDEVAKIMWTFVNEKLLI